MNIDFRDIDYLRFGNAKQIKIHKIITEHQIFEILSNYNPILVGTIPINIDIDDSDADIILQAKNLKELNQLLQDSFSQYPQFQSSPYRNGKLSCGFIIEDTQIELYATDMDTERQNGYLHMVKEYEILQSKSDDFRIQIIEFKRQGIKTEPAFCKLLNISGDPYSELLKYTVQGQSEDLK